MNEIRKAFLDTYKDGDEREKMLAQMNYLLFVNKPVLECCGPFKDGKERRRERRKRARIRIKNKKL